MRPKKVLFYRYKGKRKLTFVQFGATLDNSPDSDLAADEQYRADAPLLTEETKQTCMSSMLMCLDEKHRMVFILAELFGIKDAAGSEILSISKENFRMMLSRAKKDLYHFMQDKCGLINQNNPCRCAKKTRSLIKAGFVDPDHRLFTGKYRTTIEEAAGGKHLGGFFGLGLRFPGLMISVLASTCRFYAPLVIISHLMVFWILIKSKSWKK